jgi:lysophospholipase L1-like esterase
MRVYCARLIAPATLAAFRWFRSPKAVKLRIVIIGGLLLGALTLWSRVALAVTWKILPIGDSITAGANTSDTSGYRKPLKTLLDGAGYSTDFVGSLQNGDFADNDHEGHGGYTISQINGLTAASKIGTYQPDVTLLMVGTNDICQGRYISDMTPDLNTLITSIEGVTLNNGKKTKLIVAKITPMNPALGANGTVQGYNAQVQALVTTHANDLKQPVTWVDMYGALDPTTDISSSDKVHPTLGGYAKMASVWFDGIHAVVPAPEPGTLVLLVIAGLSLLGCARYARR